MRWRCARTWRTAATWCSPGEAAGEGEEEEEEEEEEEDNDGGGGDVDGGDGVVVDKKRTVRMILVLERPDGRASGERDKITVMRMMTMTMTCVVGIAVRTG
jgi:hypothetical protein